MRILPAVDIRGGLCVNLIQGDYGQETVFSDDPVAQAQSWHDQGGGLIHIVDLDGALQGVVCIEPQLKALHDAGIPFEVGGGIRTLESIETVLKAGAERAILGTAAHENPELLETACKAFPGQIAVGIDAKNGKVAVRGWVDVTDMLAVDLARKAEDAGAARIIYTDILSDGMMKGPNVHATRVVADSVAISVTASGGISTLADIHALASEEAKGIDETIVGRALYMKAFTVAEAIAAGKGE